MIDCNTYIPDGKSHPLRRMIEDIILPEDHYMRMRLSGALSEQCRDYYFLAHENGVGLSRIWMCHGLHTNAAANWGAVYTPEEHRGHGYCRTLLEYCFAELDRMEQPPSALFCTAGTLELTNLYRRYGFVPALAGRDRGPLYRPMGKSPADFASFCEAYYTPARSLLVRDADFGMRNEIDCLLRFALWDRGLSFGIGEATDLWPILMKERGRAKVILTEDRRCVGWMLNGEIQLHPQYRGLPLERED
ncbi:MAG: GNAT family N-acetyltransferase [Ruminococcaceae bacterium]|nr:GNAT family N-acetyltransferase [Oscillospiraceae bacterium]